ncbi:hypothetical protein [Aneurinibacillus aneurinilyticus]|uniref:Uncharacterized protein n=2 Tax=Aneurinibacillus aneurinilyticus TaxID=1391 RepID=A0A848CW11_ANEAE|nr:hypothetical protein [Aneurinibacillus aneurinilyticus]MCI1695164.1 hypothetical protein [Aneurinibacillus aneurinilyticus]MED0671793.1 hypothetical protein [Aneurinibacillus aneurinilyticus]MED0704572.1 hypothetical protein [Aneurinibacillus aneurinilyticus]MED0725216.1 hypothetical protein [Aneurinibacillus aneurinilyticus]MED0734442.1 hypothetical protein [Aneurinibacillus aneurinilyticus]
MLRNKKLSGVSKPMSLVEEIFGQQGFQRRGSKEEPVFRMNMHDTSTSQTYALEIPFKEEGNESQRFARFGEPYVAVSSSSAMRNGGTDDMIPRSISWAAESKVAEVADYLATSYRSNHI